MHVGRLKNRLLWEFKCIYRMKERNRENVRGRRTGREREDRGWEGGEVRREERKREKETQKKTRTYPWLMALYI